MSNQGSSNQKSSNQKSTVYNAFTQTVAQFAERPFLRLVSDTAARYGCAPTTITYGEALAEVNALVGVYQGLYRDLALATSGRVALMLDNRPEAFFHWLALNALGVSVVPLNPQWQAAELEYVLAHSDTRLVVALDDRQALLTGAAAALQTVPKVLSLRTFSTLPTTGDTSFCATGGLATECALLYTSGTTGKPKGCMLSNEYFLATGGWYQNLGGLCALQPGAETLITPLPMYHMNAMAVSTMGMLMTGGCIVPLDRFHPGSFWPSVAESEASILHYLGVMPAMLMGMSEQPQERQHQLKFGFGAGLSGELHRQFEARFGFQLVEAWAMTETGCAVAIIANREPRKIGTACFGFAPEYIDYRLVDDQGNDVAPGVAGELWIRRSGSQPRYGFFSGYLKDSPATDAAWADGYFHTGDLVCQDEDGALHFVDRKKNIIRRSGENIAAVEVEEVLLEHPAVTAVGVAAVPDAVREGEVFACIVTNAAVSDWPGTASDIVAHCLARLAYYKAPGYLARVAALPLTPTEKIQRAQLKTLAAELLAQGKSLDLRSMKSASTRKP